MAATLNLGKYSVKFHRIDILFLAIPVILIGAATWWFLLRPDSSNSLTPVANRSTDTSKLSTNAVVVPPTSTPIVTPKRTGLPSSSSSTAQTNNPANNAASCDAIIAEYEQKLKDLDTKIQEQRSLMSSIQVSMDLMPGGVLHQADMNKKFNAASDKANELIEQYGKTKDSYINKLLGAGCTDKLNELLY